MMGTMLLLAAFGLAACGDSATSSSNAQPAAAVSPAATTSNPTSGTTAANAAGNATNNANSNPGQAAPPAANGGTPGAGGPNRGNFNPPLTGMVQSYDATSKILTVKAADGSSQQFELSQTRLTKTSKITTDELKQLLTANSRLQITGQKNADGSYNATNLTVLDQTALPGNGNGGRGGPGTGVGPNQGQAGGTPAANGAGGQGRPNGGQGQAGQNGANPFLMLQNATLSGNQLTGTGFNGEAITVNLSTSTAMSKRTAGTTDDLKAGSAVSVTYQAAQGITPANAFAVTIG
jgi:hypothetical protein